MAKGPIIGRVAIKVLPDTSTFRSDLASDLATENYPEVKIKIIADLDEDSLRLTEARLRRWAADVGPINVGVVADVNEAAAALTEARLAGLSRARRAPIIPHVDNKHLRTVGDIFGRLSGGRLLVGMFNHVRRSLMNFDKATPVVTGLTMAMFGLLGAVIAISGNMFSLVNSIAEMGKVGLALPGILGGIAIALGISAIALADFGKQIPQIKGYWAELRSVISENFWAVAQKPMSQFIDVLFPELIRLSGQTATLLGGFFGNLATSLETKLVPRLEGMFLDLNKSIEIFSKHTDSIANIIAVLGSVGARYLPELAEWFGKILDTFSAWLTRNEESGQLFKWVDEGISAMKNFGSVIGSIASIFHSIGEAAEAAGGTTLGTLARDLRGVAAAAKDPAFQTGLTDTLRAVYDMLGRIADGAGPGFRAFIGQISKAFIELGPTMGDSIGKALGQIFELLSSPAMFKGLTALVEGFADFTDAMGPAIEPLAEKIGSVMEVMGAFAAELGPLFATAITVLSPLFVDLADSMIPIIEKTVPALEEVIKDLGPVFMAIGKHMLMVSSFIPKLIDGFMRIWRAVGPVLIPVLKILITVFSFIVKGVFAGLVDVIEGVGQAIEGLVGFFTGLWQVIEGVFKFIGGIFLAFTGDFSLLKEGASQVLSGLGEMFWGLLDVIGGALRAIWGAIQVYFGVTILGAIRRFALAIPRMIGSSFGLLRNLFTSTWSFLKEIPGRALNFILGRVSGFGPTLREKWVTIWAQMRSTLSHAWERTKSFLTGLPGRITSAIGNLGSVLWSAGWNLIHGLWEGAQSKWESFKGWMSARAADAKRLFTKPWEIFSPSRWGIRTGGYLMEGLQIGVVRGSRGMLGAIRTASSGALDQAAVMGRQIHEAYQGGWGSIDNQALPTLERDITVASNVLAKTEPEIRTLSVGNVTIPLNDLAQLNDVSEFLELLSIRVRQEI